MKKMEKQDVHKIISNLKSTFVNFSEGDIGSIYVNTFFLNVVLMEMDDQIGLTNWTHHESWPVTILWSNCYQDTGHEIQLEHLETKTDC